MPHKIVYSNGWMELDEQGNPHYYFGFGCEVCGKFFEGDYDNAVKLSNLPNNACSGQEPAGASESKKD